MLGIFGERHLWPPRPYLNIFFSEISFSIFAKITGYFDCISNSLEKLSVKLGGGASGAGSGLEFFLFRCNRGPPTGGVCLLKMLGWDKTC